MWETMLFGFPHFHSAGSFHRASHWVTFSLVFASYPAIASGQERGGIMKYWA
jgi:hypothetical protein